MKTKTQFKQHNNKNTQPKKDNKRAKRVLLLLIITIIFSFILTVGNTLALFVHVFKDKQQEGLSITTQEQQTAPPNYTFSQDEQMYYLDGIACVGDDGGFAYANFIMVGITDNAVKIYQADYAEYYGYTKLGFVGYIGLGNTTHQFQTSLRGDGGSVSKGGVVFSNSQLPSNFITSGAYLSYIRYGICKNADYDCMAVLGLQYADAPTYDFYIYFDFPDINGAQFLTYGLFVNRSELDSGDLYYVYTDNNPSLLLSYDELQTLLDVDVNEQIVELRRQIATLESQLQVNINHAYNQGREQGETIGYGNGYRDGQNDANTYTFSNVIGALIDGPVNAVMSLFDFEVLGVNLRGFFLSLITCAIVIAIIKIFM